ncbi:hypothetical protein CDAR_298001 [Caerostris darwini]|uniref:Uncharacterized protein n=1 Tax=Caerostris darwini TaxID=1538125 RepID=A0AAV4PY26_9ARAC|nr:hypothetical protein CDAR_298001 [Caerostris darwini]
MRSPRLFYPMQLNNQHQSHSPSLSYFAQKFLRARASHRKHLLPPSGSGSRSTEESFGLKSVSRQSVIENRVHLEHRTIRQDVVKGVEVTHILASQYDECKYFSLHLHSGSSCWHFSIGKN